MGMKVAAVALLCQDTRVFQAMEMAGTPCPYMGDISAAATSSWKENAEKRPDTANRSALLVREAVMTAYSLTGNLSSATELCGELADEDLPEDIQAMAVLTKLHNIAMRRPKH